jgi:hypothetical protein
MENLGPRPAAIAGDASIRTTDPVPAEEIPMIAAGPFRWLLTVLAMVSPFAATTFAATTCGASDKGALPPDADTHVVYRHYL